MSINMRKIEFDYNKAAYTNEISPSQSVLCSNFFLLAIVKFISHSRSKYHITYFSFISVLQLMQLEGYIEWWSSILILAFIMAYLLTTYLKNYKFKADHLQSLKRSPCYVWNTQDFEKSTLGQIELGQVVLVKQNENCPSNMLIIGMGSDENSCHVDSSIILGEIGLQSKKALEDTFRLLDSDSWEMACFNLKRISGEIMLEEDEGKGFQFKGKVKLRGMPKAIRIRPENYILKGTKLLSSNWIMGISMNYYEQYYEFESSRLFDSTISAFNSSLNRIVLYLFCALVGLVIISSSLCLALSDHVGSDYASILSVFIRFTLLYKNIIPISGFLMLCALRCIQKQVIQSSFFDKISIHNNEVLEDLGKVDYLLVDKTGTLTEAKISVRMCCINDILYTKERRESLTEDENPNSQMLAEEESIEYPSEMGRPGYYNLDFEILKLDSEVEEHVDHFIRCMLLCTSEDCTSHEDGLIADPEEKAMIQESMNLGYKVLLRTSKFITIQIRDEVVTYDILAFKKSSQKTLKTRIIVRDRDRTFLYIKTSKLQMSSLVKEMEDLEVMENHESIIKSLGLRDTVLGYKELTDDEVATVLLKIKQATRSQLNRNYKITSLFETFEKDLVYLGTVGIEEVISKENSEAIEFMKRAGIKTWLVSGDDQKNTLSSAVKSKMISGKTPVISISKIKDAISCVRVLHRHIKRNLYQDRFERFSERGVSNRRSRRLSIVTNHRVRDATVNFTYTTGKTSLLDELNKSIKLPYFQRQITKEFTLDKAISIDNMKYALCIDECSFKTALQNDDCRKMLVILLFCAKSVCFCNMMPDSKGKITKLLKTCLSINPTVMAVGSNESDLAMLSEADIKVSISDKSSGLLERMSDIQVKSISQIKDLLLTTGTGIYHANSKVILLYYYINFTITLISAGYTLLSDFSGTPIFDESAILIMNLLFCVFPMLYLGLFNFKNLMGTSEIYLKQKIRSIFDMKQLVKYSLHAFATTLIILLFGSLSLLGVLNSDGMVQDIELFRIICLISLTCCGIIQITIDTQRYCRFYFLSIIFSLISIVLYLTISNNVYFPENISSLIFYRVASEIADSPVVIIFLFLSPMIYFIYSSAFNIISKHIKKPSLFNYRLLAKHNHNIYKFLNNIPALYKGSSVWKTSNEPDAFNIHSISLHFASSSIENEYRIRYLKQNLKMIRYTSILLAFLHIGWICMIEFVYESDEYVTILLVVYLFIYPIFTTLTYSRIFFSIYIKFTVISIAMVLVVKTVVETNTTILGHLSAASVPAATFIAFPVDFLSICALNVENMILITISMAIGLTDESHGYQTSETVLLAFHYLIYIASITVSSGIIGYKLEKSRRINFQLMQRVVMEVQRSQNILSFLLPSFVKKRVKDGVRYIAEDQGVVSILFCDICDFDKICAMYSPQELTDFLDELFQKFDMLCEELGVTKIETVGKTYMACAGLKDSEDEIQCNIENISHANRTIELAFRILNTIENIKLCNGEYLQVKIGINSGPVIAGVVGYHKPQFSLIGDTVNTASRMCSTLQEPNAIQISTETFDYLSDTKGMAFIANKIDAKGKGVLNTYLVEEKIRYLEDFSDPIYTIKEINTSTEMSMKPSENQSNKLPDLNRFLSLTPSSSARNFSASSSSRFNRSNTTARSHDESKHRLARIDSIETKLELDVNNLYDVDNNSQTVGKVSILVDKKESSKNDDFRLRYIESNQLTLRQSLMIAFITLLLVLIINIISFSLHLNSISWEILIGKAMIIFIVLLILIFFNKLHKNKNFGWLMILIYIGGCMVSLLYLFMNIEIPSEYVALEIMFYILLICHSTGLFFRQILRGVLVVCLVWIGLIGYVDDILMHLINSIFFLGFATINAISVYNQESWFRYYSNLRYLAEKEIHKTDGLLIQMLPPHVVNNLKLDRQTTEKLYDVTLLYADIVGFTEWSSNKTPAMVVSMLSNLFTKFDKLCLDHEVYKVHTIGDCYVVMGYTGKADRTSAQECLNVIRFAESMIDVIDEVNRESGSSLKMRIGVHTGEVIAGIIGTKIVRYDIYGPDVLIANKMESGGKPGAINVSDVTMQFIKSLDQNKYEFQYNKEIEITHINRSYNSFYIRNKQEHEN
jgi:magnesium-transporting ATPase (P-type)/class 3 adenylate cyclase